MLAPPQPTWAHQSSVSRTTRYLSGKLDVLDDALADKLGGGKCTQVPLGHHLRLCTIQLSLCYFGPILTPISIQNSRFLKLILLETSHFLDVSQNQNTSKVAFVQG